MALGVGPTYLSALEKGRKSPPHNVDFFEKLLRHLELSDDEINELRHLATATETLGPLAIGASPLQLETAVEFAARLTWLQPKQLRAIKSILDMAEPPSKTSLI